ncbi:MAG: DNA gyrase subunit A, partial [Actinomycetota bacterium]|nr:DNA gyrase subunit A [Actinomycetota bacterium]
LLFISQNGMVQRTNAGGISQTGRATQGVRVMNMKEDDCVSAVALVVESSTPAGIDGAEQDELADAIGGELTPVDESTVDGLAADEPTGEAPEDLGPSE